ncbi:carboxymuconolactone decarboxylase family protein [Francisellaceae bacterium]|nr:carboxymuconolactone decarboxylase family protein [Francisellaceae bacterium]
MDYAQISKDTISLLHKSYNSLDQSPLNQGLRSIIELRVSQLNGCAYCCELHSNGARKQQVPQKKLDALPAWETSALFSDIEKIALDWAECLTLSCKDSESIKPELTKYFSDREVVDLTACVSLMNALNRMAISLKD